MANYFYEPNLVITKFNIAKDGELKDLEINGQDIDLGGEVPLENNKAVSVGYTAEITPSTGYTAMKKVTLSVSLYAWKNEDSDPIYAYTLSATPTAGDIALMPDASTLALDDDPITTIGEDTITAFSTTFTRDDTKDIELV